MIAFLDTSLPYTFWFGMFSGLSRSLNFAVSFTLFVRLFGLSKFNTTRRNTIQIYFSNRWIDGLTRCKIIDVCRVLRGSPLVSMDLLLWNNSLAALILVLTLLRILLKLAQSCGSFDLIALIFDNDDDDENYTAFVVSLLVNKMGRGGSYSRKGRLF